MSEIFLVVTLRAAPGQEDALRHELEALVEPSRRDPGNLRYDLFGDTDNPGRFVIFQHWSSEDDQHRHHTTSPHVRRFSASTSGNIESIESVQTLKKLA